MRLDQVFTFDHIERERRRFEAFIAAPLNAALFDLAKQVQADPERFHLVPPREPETNYVPLFPIAR